MFKLFVNFFFKIGRAEIDSEPSPLTRHYVDVQDTVFVPRDLSTKELCALEFFYQSWVVY